MQINWFTFFAQIVNFLILVAMLRRFLYRPVIKAMDNREEQITGRVEEARRKLLDANEKEAKYQKKLAEFNQQRDHMLQEVKKEVEQQRKSLMTEVRNEIDKQQQRWENNLQNQKEAFLRELQVQAGGQILDISRKMLQDLSSKELEKQVMEVFIQRLSELSPDENRRLVKSALDFGAATIEIKSSFELSDSHKKQIRRLLQLKIAPRVACSFEVVPALGFGIEIRAGGWRTGWNLNSYVGQLREGMEQSFSRKMDGGIQLSRNGSL